MDVRLVRHSSTKRFGTFGELEIGGQILHTVERPWVGNKRMLSCIPEGTYTCKRVNSPKFGATFEVTKVPGRSHILFHAANTSGDLHGCIGLGLALGVVYNKWAVISSRLAIKEFERLTLGWGEFTLEVTSARTAI